jgi:hemerythrin-like domain-containing protein
MTYALVLAQALNNRTLKTFESYAELYAHTLASAFIEKHKELEEAKDILRSLIDLAEAGYPLELSEFTRASRFLASLEGK